MEDAAALAAIHAAARRSAMPDIAPLFATEGEWVRWIGDAFLDPAHRKGYRALHEIWEGAPDRRPPGAECDRPPHALVVLADGAPAGFAVWYAAGAISLDRRGVTHEPGHLRMFYVDPAHQGRGLGGRLLRRVLGDFDRQHRPLLPVMFADALGEGWQPDMILWVMKPNRRAAAFFRRHGFRTTRSAPGRSSIGVPLLCMRRAAAPDPATDNRTRQEAKS
jgi:ribosomal protein S18 acetylase RimI-like enzyme